MDDNVNFYAILAAALMIGGFSAVTGTLLSSALIAIALINGTGIIPVFLGSPMAFSASPLIDFIETTAIREDELYQYTIDFDRPLP